MQHIQQVNPLARQFTSFAPLRVTTIQPPGWEQLATRMKETGMRETITEIFLATTTFSLVGNLLFSLYRALEHYTVIPLHTPDSIFTGGEGMTSWILLIGVPLLVCAGCGGISRTFMNASWRDRWQQPEVVVHSLSPPARQSGC